MSLFTDLSLDERRQLLLGNNLYEECRKGKINAMTLKKLQMRTCVVNHEMDQNLNVSNLVELCGLDKTTYNLPNFCCFCNNARSKEQVYTVKPCNHTVHAQCVRKVHEYRLRNLITDQAAYRYPKTLVLCPICLEPIHATVQELYSLSTMPHELVKRTRDNTELVAPITFKKVRFDSDIPDDLSTDLDKMDMNN